MVLFSSRRKCLISPTFLLSQPQLFVYIYDFFFVIFVCCVWNVFVGGKMVDDGEGALEVLQARLLESESMARHFEGLVQERDHQLNQANRVSSGGSL